MQQQAAARSSARTQQGTREQQGDKKQIARCSRNTRAAACSVQAHGGRAADRQRSARTNDVKSNLPRSLEKAPTLHDTIAHGTLLAASWSPVGMNVLTLFGCPMSIQFRNETHHFAGYVSQTYCSHSCRRATRSRSARNARLPTCLDNRTDLQKNS